MTEPVSQKVQAPFCLLPIRPVFRSAGISPVNVALAIGGMTLLLFGIWDLIQSLPRYSVSIAIILFGAALFWIGTAPTLPRLRALAASVGYWIGVDSDRFVLAMHDQAYSRSWNEIGAFRVRETTNGEFVTKYKGRAGDDEINYVHTTLLTLSAAALDGPPIEIPFEHFIPADQGRRAAADNLCMFLNDVRHRALNGGLAHGAAPFLAPADLRIAPVRALPPDQASPTNAKVGRPVVQRQD